MWIKKLYATFGKLSNETLSLDKGLNVVYGKNESGKSTWSAFIRAMFYGISTREQKKAGFLPDKEKFLPWNGEAMYGKMELSEKGGDMTIERVASKAGILSKCSSTYDGNGKEAPTGEELLGVSLGVYERTAFIKQSAIAVSSDSETEKRILSIASSGDEEVSAGEVITRLKKRRSLLRGTAKNAEIPNLERELASLMEKLSESESREGEIARAKESIEVLTKELDKRKRDLKIARAEEEAYKRSYIATAKEEFAAAAERKRATESYPTRRELDLFTEKKNAQSSLLLGKEQGEKASALFREELLRTEAKMNASPFAGKTSADATALAEADVAGIASGGKKNTALFIISALLAALCIAAGILFTPLAFIGAVLFAAFSVGILLAGKKAGKVSEEISGKYGEATEACIKSALSDYLALLGEREKISKKLSENDEANKKQEMLLSLYLEDMKKFAETFIGVSLDDVAEIERRLRELVSISEAADLAEKEARAKVEALSAAASVETEDIEYTDEEIPDETVPQIEKAIKILTEQIKRYEIALATVEGSMSDFSREKALQRRDNIMKRLERLNFEFDAINLAIDTIDEAEVELKNRFSPEIEKRTAEIFRYLTGGSYELVKIRNSEFEMDVASGVATAPREKLSLSAGTVDELYFALRLALFETIVPEETAPPLVLDDVFVNFDRERMEKALDLLREKALDRQIIVFSCHEREAEYLKEDKNVRIIAL